MKKLLFALSSLLLCATAHAQWKTTTYTLKGGWNAIYLPGDATYDTINNLFPSTVLEVWRWQPNPNGVQFTTSPLTPSEGTAEWATWKRDGSVLTLSSLIGQSAYLVKCDGASANTYTVTLKQSPQLPANSWVRNGANLLGFPSYKNDSTYPTMSTYFATFPAAIASNSKVYKYVGGDLGPGNPLQVFSTGAERLDATQAYWFSAEVTDKFYAPLEISPSSNGGLVFGRDGSTVKVLVRNRSAAVVNITLTPVASESAPSGQTAVAGSVPLTRRTYNASTYQWVETPITAAYTVTIDPNTTTELNFGINRADATMTAAAADASFASLLRITDSTLMDVYLPVTAKKASLAGLWMGDVSLTNVSNKVSNGAQATATIANGVVTGLNLVGSGGFGYTNMPPVVMISAPNPNGNINATATAAIGPNGSVTSITPTVAGIGYSSPPNVSLSEPPAVNAKASSAVAGGSVSGLTLTDAGSSYVTPPTIIIDAPPASVRATGTAVVSGSKNLSAITLGTAGSYYATAPAVTIAAPSAAVTAAGTAVLSAGTVNSITVSNAGTNYSTAPVVTISPPASAPATAGTPVVSASKTISSIPVSTGGGYYITAPTVTIAAPPAATTAVGTASVSAGTVNSITVSNAGTNYSTAPVVTISPPPPSAIVTATATAAIGPNGSVTSITPTGTGIGYSSPPNVSLSAPSPAIAAEASASVTGGRVTGIALTKNTRNYTGMTTPPTVTIAEPPASAAATGIVTMRDGSLTSIAVGTGGGYYTDPSIWVHIASPISIYARATVNLAPDYSVNSVTVNDGGTNYASVPAVRLYASLGRGSGATATAALGLTAQSFAIDPGTQRYGAGGGPEVTISGGGGTGATATAVLTLGAVTGININNPGVGYTTAPTISFTAGVVTSAGTAPTGTGNARSFRVSSISVTNGGVDYRLGCPCSIDLPTGAVPATANATVSNGVVTAFNITNAGFGYATAPEIYVPEPYIRYGAAAECDLNPFNGVMSFIMTNNGFGYTTAPTVTISDPPAPVQATAIATVTNGMVTGYTITNAGTNYTSTPAITVAAPPTPITATAICSVNNGRVDGFTISNPGVGYTTAPSVTVASPPAAVTATATANLTYITAPSVTVASPPAAVTATATANLTFTPDYEYSIDNKGVVSSFTITNAGTNYNGPPAVTVSGGTFTALYQAKYNAERIGDGVVSFVKVDAGAGYRTTPTVTVTAPPAAVQAVATASVSNGAVTGYTVTNAGTNYTSTPAITVALPPSPSQATASATLTGHRVSALSVTNPGAGYPVAPKLTLTAPSGNPLTATAQAVLTNGIVSGYTITNAGFGYTSVPTVSVDPAQTHIGATAEAIVANGSVTGFTVTSGGGGYEKVPSVSVALPPAQTGTSTPNLFKLRTLLHISDGSAARLLSRAYLGTLAVAPNASGICTTESLLKADSLNSAMRFSAAHLPAGGIYLGTRSGDSYSFTVTNPYDGVTNPFVHKYHPDHDNMDSLFQNKMAAGVESPNIGRACTFTFTSTPPAGSTTPTSSWGSSVIGGTYSENITGIHKEPLNVSGTFELRRASQIGTLSQ